MNELRTLVDSLVDFRNQKTKLKDDLKLVESEIESLTQRMDDEMSKLEITSVKYEGIGNVIMGQRESARATDKEALFGFLRSEGLADLITETVNAKTLSSAHKDYADEFGKNMPGVEVYSKLVVTIRKG